MILYMLGLHNGFHTNTSTYSKMLKAIYHTFVTSRVTVWSIVVKPQSFFRLSAKLQGLPLEDVKHAHVQDGPSMTKSDHKELHHQKNYQEIETPSKISKQAISCANQGDSTSTPRLKSVELVIKKDLK